MPYDDLATIETDGLRQYIIPDSGLKFETYPSITTVLGFSKEKSIDQWKKWIGEEKADRICQIAADRGSSLHGMLERYIRNDEEVITPDCMPDAIAMFRTLIPEINRCVGKVYLQEKPLYSTHLKVAGRTDMVAEWENRLSIVDFKNSGKIRKRENITSYFMQLAAYAIMFEERTGIPVDQGVIVMAVEGYNKPLIFKEKRDNWVKPLLKVISAYEEAHPRKP